MAPSAALTGVEAAERPGATEEDSAGLAGAMNVAGLAATAKGLAVADAGAGAAERTDSAGMDCVGSPGTAGAAGPVGVATGAGATGPADATEAAGLAGVTGAEAAELSGAKVVAGSAAMVKGWAVADAGAGAIGRADATGGDAAKLPEPTGMAGSVGTTGGSAADGKGGTGTESINAGREAVSHSLSAASRD